jgi:hypothetical protein
LLFRHLYAVLFAGVAASSFDQVAQVAADDLVPAVASDASVHG